MTPALRDRRILVLGLGVTGLSMARWLHARSATVSVADSRAAPPNVDTLQAELPGVPVVTGPFRAETFRGIDMLAVSPGVPLSDPYIRRAMAAGVPAVGDIELFALGLDELAAVRGVPRPAILAITGSNGKSTVTEMTGAACRTAGWETLVAGNIGLPVLDALARIEIGAHPMPQAVVLELSSFQLETTASLRPDAAVVLNVSEDHLDRYEGMAEYAAAKARVFVGAGIVVVNRQDDWTTGMVPAGAQAWTFGLDRAPGPRHWGLLRHGGRDWIAEGERPVLEPATLRVAGLHNAANAMATLALAAAAGVPENAVVQALRAFAGLAHRVEFVAEVDGCRYYDDSKGTNVGATVAALAGLPQPVVLIAGGDGKGQDFTPLAAVAAARARAVVLIGRDAPRIAEVLASVGVPVVKAADMDDAVRRAAAAARPGDAVLLSPACASFDMFRNYEHRAEVFRAAVARLQEARACSA
jgi:UDP-N-acetylmuramoylalanine--D-glutamate ligase